ncbi:MAG: 1,4-dihydroxy-6-naphthoate synthase [bacterium]
MDLQWACSPCPNDTFTFFGMASKRVALPGHAITLHLHDIETLNQLALRSHYAITKLSFHTWLLLGNRYRLLSAGNALGYGCGPVLVSRRPVRQEELPDLRIVLPGEHTTAHLLFRLYCPAATRRTFTTYDQIFPEILAGHADCGVVIHEGRFLYEQAGLHKVCDLGQWWEETTGAPIPLGAMAVRSDLPPEMDELLANLVRQSLQLSRSEPGLAMPYVRQMAIELDEAVLEKQIELFVNDFTLDLGDPGRRAVDKLRELACAAGIVT